MSTPPPIPTALVVPIIEGYVEAIRPAFTFILIPPIFSAMLVPLLIMLFALSTPQTRRGPIFILNVISISLGITLGALSAHLAMESILFPFTGISVIEDVVFTILDVWLSWLTEAVLLVRIAVAFPRAQLPLLLAFPIAIKIGRAVINILFSIQWTRKILAGGAVNQFTIIQNLNLVWFKSAFVLELVDNSYVSGLFLWRLAKRGHLFNGSKIGRFTSSNGKRSYTSRLQSLFWIASTNFVFPLIFSVSEIIAIFLEKVILSASLHTVNVYVAIISTVFATIWSSTASFEAATSSGGTTVSYSTAGEARPVVLQMDRMTATAANAQGHPDISVNMKPEHWHDSQSNIGEAI
ncbi:hypothetical protein C8R43DRAFT_1024758 [Mycena crocata]|nr:hypothetical protein C8R43DRAFT_1024758 [Mycena crocata]